MTLPILVTKLHVPTPRPHAVERVALLQRLNAGLTGRLTLVSAPAGFGKTTLVSEWVSATTLPAAWLSLDESDSEAARFLAYVVTALRTVVPNIGDGALRLLDSPQKPSTISVLTSLLNDLADRQDKLLLVLDDYHIVDSEDVDRALTFLAEHLPPSLHVIIITREDPQLPLARLRARHQLSELRAADLRFNSDEAADFLNRAMGLSLSLDDVHALETRTEGWVAGLQLAAISLQGRHDVADFIRSFTGSHRFVLDYLVEEVLHRQTESVQTFLLRTSILDRLCGPLCDAVLGDSSVSSPDTLAFLERANLFLVPLDDERQWYRYHHLFAELLRQRLRQSHSSSSDDGVTMAELHTRASVWYEANGYEIEAFGHAAAAGDITRAARLVEGGGMPLYYRGGAAVVLNWLKSLPTDVLDRWPALWVMYATVLTVAGLSTAVEEKLQAAEAALEVAEPGEVPRDLIGQIAVNRAMRAAPTYDVDTLFAQSRRALDNLHPDNLPARTVATWTLAIAHQFQGDRAAAVKVYKEVVGLSEASGNNFMHILGGSGLAIAQESQTRLRLAETTFRSVVALAGDPPQPAACEAFLGLARLSYEWNDLAAAEADARRGLHLARQIENIDGAAASEIFLARLKAARGDVEGALAMLAQAAQTASRDGFALQAAEAVAAQIQVLLGQGRLAEAAELTQAHDLPLGLARVRLAEGDPVAALALLGPLREAAEARTWADDRLKVRILEALAHDAHGDIDAALRELDDLLALAEREGYIRTFVDEGLPMARLLAEAAARGVKPGTAARLLAAFDAEAASHAEGASSFAVQPLIEPLSERELEVLHLVAQGLSNREISERLFLALSTVKGHNRVIFDKLHVQRRTEAVARARELGLL